MAQLKKVVEPFGEVNVYPAGPGRLRVVATILMEPRREGTQTGIALDGSGSMAPLYGIDTGGGVVSSIFSKGKPSTNQITPVAQQVCAYLARKIDADGGTTCIYWATGPGGSQVEVIGDLTAEQAERKTFGPPRQFGTGTQLLPAVRYFVERFATAPWGFYAFITDGELHDLDEVKQYSRKLAQDVSAGRRRPVKFVLIGVGRDVNERQMEELDDLETGTQVDLWDHKLAAELRQLQQIFAEVVDANARVADRGKVLDPQGRTVRDYSDVGLPPKLEFEIDAIASYFTLDVQGTRIHQGLSDTAAVPASQVAVAQPAAPPPLPATPAQPASFEDIPVAEPVEEVPLAEPVQPAKPAAKPVEKKKDDDWLGFDLEFDKDPNKDLDLGKGGDKK
jgi:hypothetical protein